MKIIGFEKYQSSFYRLYKTAEEFKGNLTPAFHHIRESLKYSWITWHISLNPEKVIQQVHADTVDFINIYNFSKQFVGGLLDDFEMNLAISIVLANRTDLAETCRKLFSFRPCSNGYAYYAGFKGALIGIMLNDRELIDLSREQLKKYNPNKIFYYPSKSVIFAAMEGDMVSLKSNIKNITKKFDGYAVKMKAISEDCLDVSKLDGYWFSPYPDWAFYILAIKAHGPIDQPGSIWMPMELLNYYHNR